MILSITHPVLIPVNKVNITLPKKHLDVNFNHIADIITAKISRSCYLFLDAILNSLRYYFADDSNS